ncbi:hypothetical protein D1872_273390 [compost metagenome]
MEGERSLVPAGKGFVVRPLPVRLSAVEPAGQRIRAVGRRLFQSEDPGRPVAEGALLDVSNPQLGQYL